MIGASFIGLEAAAALLCSAGSRWRRSRPRRSLARILGEACLAQGVHQAHGVRFNLSARPRAIRPREIESGKIVAADLVIMGVGVRPRTGLAEAAGLPCMTAWSSTRC